MNKYKKKSMLEKIIDLVLLFIIVPIIIISIVILPFGGIVYLLFKIKARKYEERNQ